MRNTGNIHFDLTWHPNVYKTYSPMCTKTSTWLRTHKLCLNLHTHAFKYSHIRTFMHSFTHSSILLFMHSFIHSCLDTYGKFNIAYDQIAPKLNFMTSLELGSQQDSNLNTILFKFSSYYNDIYRVCEGNSILWRKGFSNIVKYLHNENPLSTSSWRCTHHTHIHTCIFEIFLWTYFCF